MPGRGPVSGLLEQLSPGRLDERLAGHVTQSRRDLPEGGTDRVPVLPDHEDPIFVIESQDGDRARVLNDFPGNEVTVGQLDGIRAQRHDVPASQEGRLPNRPGAWFVANISHAQALATGRPAPAAATASPAGTARLRSSAAATSPLKSGCGRVGLDSNSGCACVATK